MLAIRKMEEQLHVSPPRLHVMASGELCPRRRQGVLSSSLMRDWGLGCNLGTTNEHNLGPGVVHR
jgi:hypothetical protein